MVLLYEFCRLQTYILDSERQDLIIYHVGDAFRDSIGCQYSDKQCARRGTKHPRYNKRSLTLKGRAIMDGRTVPLSLGATVPVPTMIMLSVFSTFGLRDKQASLPSHAG